VLTGARLDEASLRGANLSASNLIEVTLRRANLEGADLNNSGLIDAVLREANLKGANLSEADLFGADLTGADLSGADLSESRLTRAILTGAISRSKLKGADAGRERATSFGRPRRAEHDRIRRSIFGRAFLRRWRSDDSSSRRASKSRTSSSARPPPRWATISPTMPAAPAAASSFALNGCRVQALPARQTACARFISPDGDSNTGRRPTILPPRSKIFRTKILIFRWCCPSTTRASPSHRQRSARRVAQREGLTCCATFTALAVTAGTASNCSRGWRDPGVRTFIKQRCEARRQRNR
jgi:hypothetical protein